MASPAWCQARWQKPPQTLVVKVFRLVIYVVTIVPKPHVQRLLGNMPRIVNHYQSTHCKSCKEVSERHVRSVELSGVENSDSDICWIFTFKFIILELGGGWTNPFEKYARQIGSFPQGSGWKLKNIWNHHLVVFFLKPKTDILASLFLWIRHVTLVECVPKSMLKKPRFTNGQTCEASRGEGGHGIDQVSKKMLIKL